MIWIIVVAAILVTVAVLYSTKRLKVLKAKEELERTMESVISSFRDLTVKIRESDLGDHEKSILVGNIERNIAQLERWRDSSLPNVTFWKNHTKPIEKEFKDLQDSVAADLARYEELSAT